MENNDFNLNSEQQAAVNETEGPVLVIAGAGSGKTRVLTARICHLIEMGVNPYNILAITFTNKAANEMKERIAKLGQFDVWASTFHSMCARILRQEIDKIGYSKDFTIYTDIESSRTVARLIKDSNGDEDDEKKDKKNEILGNISKAKSYFLDPDEYYKKIKDEPNARYICDIYRKYEEELNRCNALDFDDLLCKTIVLFKECPDVLLKYASRFLYIHVDEFQDTNNIQFQLVDMLQSYHHNLFVVGDEDQSIYSWRGSNIRNILDFPKKYSGTHVFKLERNYRSTKSILDAANNVIKNNSHRNVKNLWTDTESSVPIEIYEARDDREESEKIVRAIKILHTSGESYKEMAILVRSNSISRQFEESLNLYNVPYKIFGGTKFYERKEIKDFLSYIRLAVNPKDNDSFLRATTFPSRKIGDKSREEIALYASDLKMSLYDFVYNKDICPLNIYTKFLPLTEVITNLHNVINTMSIPEFLQYALNKSMISDVLKGSKKEEDRNRLENIEELITAGEHFQNDNDGATIFDFLQSTALMSDADEMDDEEYVTIATVHAVKGLEFDNVFIAACEENIFPSIFSVQEGNIEEERRLMYVAITRARKKLVVTHCKQRYRFGTTQYEMKSRFIEEMGVISMRQQSKPTPQQQRPSQPIQSNPFQDKIDSMIKQGLEAKAKAQENLAKSANKYNVGYFVEHKKFGIGKVTSVAQMDGDIKISIQFPQLGIKTFSLSIAANLLKIVDDPSDIDI